jgi:hypothetical protein
VVAAEFLTAMSVRRVSRDDPSSSIDENRSPIAIAAQHSSTIDRPLGPGIRPASAVFDVPFFP